MSTIPAQIPDVGDSGLCPRANPAFVPGQGFGSEEYFVLSRCDGSTSFRDIILITGFGTDKTVEILRKLRQAGAVLLPGETSPPAVPSAPQVTPVSDAVSTPIPPLDESVLNEEERQAMAADSVVPEKSRRKILSFRQRLSGANHFEVLGVSPDADSREIKRAYFRLSKEFHPDRYYGKDVGPFQEWMNEAFKAVTDAFNVIGNRKNRAKYERDLRGDASAQAETKEEHAESLFRSACEAELAGSLDDAMQRFAAAVRMQPLPKYLRRATMCAVQAQKYPQAEAFARQAIEIVPQDPSYQRVLADVFRAQGRWPEAKQVLEAALTIHTENDVLFGELQSDLAAVQSCIDEENQSA